MSLYEGRMGKGEGIDILMSNSVFFANNCKILYAFKRIFILKVSCMLCFE